MNALVWLVPFFVAWIVLQAIACRLDWQRKMRNRAREDYFMRDQKESLSPLMQHVADIQRCAKCGGKLTDLGWQEDQYGPHRAYRCDACFGKKEKGNGEA